MADDHVQITVSFGKQQEAMAIPFEEDGKVPVVKLKELIEPLFGIPVASQKLLFRGKELADATILELATLPSKPKMMLLNRSHSNTSTKPSTATRVVHPIEPTPSPPPPRVIEVIPVGDNQVLVEVVRAKERYRMALDTTSSILDLKTHVERLSGVAVRSQRLLFKGKYPPDDSVLSSLLSTLKTTSKLVFMLLFDERHHVRMDIQTTTEDLVKECADHMAHLARLKAQISKNFFDASDIGLQLRELLDAVDILASNVDIANDAAPSEDLCRLSTKAVALRDAVALVLDTLFARRT